MILQSENLSQAEFVRAILERDARNISKAQNLILSDRVYMEGKDLKASRRKKGLKKRTGKLEDALVNPDFIIQASGESFTVVGNYPIYIRFLDMKHLGNWRIYNRQIWGILYNNALKDIKFRYGQAVTDYVGNALKAAGEKFNITWLEN